MSDENDPYRLICLNAWSAVGGQEKVWLCWRGQGRAGGGVSMGAEPFPVRESSSACRCAWLPDKMEPRALH